MWFTRGVVKNFDNQKNHLSSLNQQHWCVDGKMDSVECDGVKED
jgi:hypothetical protein